MSYTSIIILNEELERYQRESSMDKITDHHLLSGVFYRLSNNCYSFLEEWIESSLFEYEYKLLCESLEKSLYLKVRGIHGFYDVIKKFDELMSNDSMYIGDDFDHMLQYVSERLCELNNIDLKDLLGEILIVLNDNPDGFRKKVQLREMFKK